VPGIAEVDMKVRTSKLDIFLIAADVILVIWELLRGEKRGR